MKHAFLKNINCLLVELPKGARILRVSNNILTVEIQNDNLDTSDYRFPFNIQHIAPFEAMSEEMFYNLVESEVFYHYDASEFTKYKDYVEFLKVGEHDWAYCLLTARESFLSAVEAENYRIGVMEEKPEYPQFAWLGDRSHNVSSSVVIRGYEQRLKEWKQAQSRTFDPALTHVFKTL